MRKLLSKKPYKIAYNYSKYESFRVNLNPGCGFEKGDKVYQVRRDDGVLELIPEKLFNEAEFNEEN